MVEMQPDSLGVAGVILVNEQGGEMAEEMDVDHEAGVLADGLGDLPAQSLLGLRPLPAAGEQPAAVSGADEQGPVAFKIKVKGLGQHVRDRLAQHPLALDLLTLELEPDRLPPPPGAAADDVALD